MCVDPRKRGQARSCGPGWVMWTGSGHVVHLCLRSDIPTRATRTSRVYSNYSALTCSGYQGSLSKYFPPEPLGCVHNVRRPPCGYLPSSHAVWRKWCEWVYAVWYEWCISQAHSQAWCKVSVVQWWCVCVEVQEEM